MTVPEAGLCEKGDQKLCESRWAEEHYRALAILKSVGVGLKLDRWRANSKRIILMKETAWIEAEDKETQVLLGI